MASRQFPRSCAPLVPRGLTCLGLAILATVLAIAPACSGTKQVSGIATSVTAGTKTRFAYVANRSDSTLSILVYDPVEQQLRHNGYVVTGTEPADVASDPSGSFVFVANSGDDTVSGYTVDAKTGRLTEVAGSPFGTGMTPSSVAVSASGTFVYTANSGDDTISAFSMNVTTGVLTEVMGSPFMTGANPTSVTTFTGDTLVYVTNTDDDSISVFVVDPTTGALSELSGSPFATQVGPTSVTFNATGSIAYVTNFLAGSVSAFVVTKQGALGELASSPYTTGSGPFSMTLDSAGQFAYVANFNSNNVSAFAIQPDGALVPAVGSPFAAGASPVSIALDLEGRSAFVANSGDHTVSEYAVDGLTGELMFQRVVRTRLGPASLALAAGTSSVTFAPGFLYTANFSSNDLSIAAIDPSTGDLTEIANSPVPTPVFSNEEALALDPLGEFAYFPCGASDVMTVYRIEEDGGLVELSSLPFGTGSPISVGDDPRAVAVDPSGRFVYVAVRGANLIRGFTIDRPSGELTPMGMTFGSTLPTDLSVDPTGRFAFVTGDNDTLTSFSIDPDSGELTQIAPVFSAASALLNLVSPNGAHVYVLHQTTGAGIDGFNVNATTGVLTPIAGSPFSSGAVFPFSFAMDPIGRFLFIGDINGGEEVVSLSINPSTGALANVSTSTSSIGNLLGVGIDITGSFIYCGENAPVITEFLVNRQTGALTLDGSATLAGVSGPRGLTTSGSIE